MVLAAHGGRPRAVREVARDEERPASARGKRGSGRPTDSPRSTSGAVASSAASNSLRVRIGQPRLRAELRAAYRLGSVARGEGLTREAEHAAVRRRRHCAAQ